MTQSDVNCLALAVSVVVEEKIPVSGDIESDAHLIGEALLLAMQMVIGARSTAIVIANCAPKNCHC